MTTLLTDVELASATWRLVLDGDGWRLDPLGHRVRAIGLAADELADAGALLQDALAPPTRPPPATAGIAMLRMMPLPSDLPWTGDPEAAGGRPSPCSAVPCRAGL